MIDGFAMSCITRGGWRLPLHPHNSSRWFNPGLTHLNSTLTLPKFVCRLANLSVDTLELRRLHSDLVLVYKILFGLVDIIANDFFSLQYALVYIGERGNAIEMCVGYTSILLILLFSFIASSLGLVLMANLLLGLLLIYHLDRSFVVSINSISSAHSPLRQGAPQGSVLGPLLFILYSTPLSSLISDSSVGHHLIDDNTQLFISFRAPELSANILHQQNTIDLVSQWMSANLLLLNQSKTEFLLIGLPAQLSKVSDPSLQMPSNFIIIPARNLGVIFDSTLSMSDRISFVSNPCFLSIRDLLRIRNTLDFSTARTIAISLIHSKLEYCNSLFLNLPQS